MEGASGGCDEGVVDGDDPRTCRHVRRQSVEAIDDPSSVVRCGGARCGGGWMDGWMNGGVEEASMASRVETGV
jgi:hypothetical protein